MATLARRSRRSTAIWPGFVDALATLLLVVIFLLLMFVLAQFFLNEALSGRDAALDRLRRQVSELAELLALERKANQDLTVNINQLSAELQASVRARDDLGTTVRTLTGRAETAEGRVAELAETLAAANETIESQVSQLAALTNDIAALQALKEELEREAAALVRESEETESALIEERKVSESTRAQVTLLNQQMAALREQIRELTTALAVSEKLAEEQGVQIEALGKRLNAALAGKVQELSRYRSEFFGRLRELLGDHPGIRVVGDRFVFQSEVLFESGSAELGDAGKEQLGQLATTLLDVAGRIPAEVNWVLRVDGHTDRVPINNWRYPSNWELSSARAISVVKFLTNSGIPSNRLAAAGFGEFQPLDAHDDEIAFRRNRRIEIKLTQH